MEEFIKEIEKIRDIEVNYQKKCKCEDENNSDLYFYTEGRIGAFSDVLLSYYFHFKEKGVN